MILSAENNKVDNILTAIEYADNRINTLTGIVISVLIAYLNFVE